LKKITIPKNVSSIGAYAFEKIPWLDRARKKTPMVVVGDIVVNGKQCSGEVVIPEGITKINAFSFAECHELKKIKVPEGMKLQLNKNTEVTYY